MGCTQPPSSSMLATHRLNTTHSDLIHPRIRGYGSTSRNLSQYPSDKHDKTQMSSQKNGKTFADFALEHSWILKRRCLAQISSERSGSSVRSTDQGYSK